MEVCFYILLLLASGVNGYNQEHDSNTESRLEETLSKIGSLFENLELIYQLKPTLTEIVNNNREAARIMCVSGDPVVIQMEFSKGGKIVTISKYVNGDLNHKSMLWQMNDRDSELLDQLETDSWILLELVKIRIELVRAEQILASLKDQFEDNSGYLYYKNEIKILFEKVQKFKGSLKGTKNCFKWKKTVIVAGGVTGAALLSAAVVGLIALMGFTSAGIVAGSIAAGLMSSSAVASGGGIAAGSTVAILQAIGASGLGATLSSIVAGAGLLSGSAASAMIAELIDWMYYGC